MNTVSLIQLFAFFMGMAVQPLLEMTENAMAVKRGLSLVRYPAWTKAAAMVLCGMLFCLLLGQRELTGKWVFTIVTVSLCWMITLFDFKYHLVPNEMVLAMFAVGLTANITGYSSVGPMSSLMGCMAVGSLFLILFFSGGKVGAGDVKLAAAVGFCAGLVNSLVIMAIMGLLLMVYSMISKGLILKLLRTYVPMGPFVTAAYLLFMLR